MARHRHAALRDGDRRRCDRRGADGHAPGRGDAVRGLRLLRLGPPRHRGRQAALPRRHADPDRRAAARRAAAFRAGPFHSQNPGELVRAHPGSQDRVPVDAGRRERVCSRPRSRTRTPCSSSSTSTSTAGSRARCPDDRYTIPFGEARIHRAGDDVTVVTWGAMVYTADRGGREARSRTDVSVEILDLRTLIPWDRDAVLASVQQDARRCSSSTRTRAPAASAPRSPRRSPRRRSSISTPRSCASLRPTTPVPFSPPLEKAFIPQVEDVAAGAPRAGGVLRTEGVATGTADRRRDAPDGRLRLGRDDHEVAEAGRATRSPPTSRCSRSRPTRSTPRCRAPARASSRQILVQEGETVEVGTMLAMIGAADAAEIAAVAASPFRARRPADAGTRGRREPARRRRRRAGRQPQAHACRRSATAGRSSRPSWRGSPPSTASIRAACRAPAPAAA